MPPPPATTIELQRDELQRCAAEGLITADQAEALWQRWSAARGPHGPSQPAVHGAGPAFDFTHVLYYFGGMVAIGAMSLFLTVGFERMGPAALLVIGLVYFLVCLVAADHLLRRGLRVAAGILAALAVVLVPLVVWSVQSLLGWWPAGITERFAHYHAYIDWRWLSLEIATLLAGVAMLWRYRLPFMVMPLAVTLWYMSMDLANLLAQQQGLNWTFNRDVSLGFGVATCAVAMAVDWRNRAMEAALRQDFAFWLYLFGAFMFWGSLSLRDAGSEWARFGYCLINVAMIFGGALIGRRVFTVLGAFGVAGYLGSLAHRLFQDSLWFPLALTLIGLGFVGLGVLWQRHESGIQARLRIALSALRH